MDSRRLVPHLDKVLKILLSLKNKLLPIKDSTKNGSIYIMDIHRSEFERLGFNKQEVIYLFQQLVRARICFPIWFSDYDKVFDYNDLLYSFIFPAPVLEDEFIESLKGEKIEKREEAKLLTETVKPTVEIGKTLEETVSNVFKKLGFEASKMKIRGRSGVEHEIDVLARKDLGDIVFKIGVECKNWKNKDCGLNMYIVIAKAFTDDAKKMAKAYGLIPIREDKTRTLFRKFSGLVIGIAKQPLVDSILQRIDEMERELNSFRIRLNELARDVKELIS